MGISFSYGVRGISLALLILGGAPFLSASETGTLENGSKTRGSITITLQERNDLPAQATIDKVSESPLKILSEEGKRYEESVVAEKGEIPSIQIRMEENPTSKLGMVPVVAGGKKSPEKELYLTFDDGPVHGTGNVLRVLEEEGVEASMFFVGRHVQKRPHLYELCRRMANIEIANHTYSHANGHYQRFYRDTYGVMSDVEHAQLVIGGRKYLRLAGRNVWRIPEVHRNDHAIAPRQRQIEIDKYETISREGFFIYGWDVEWRFDKKSGRPMGSPEELARRIEGIYRHSRSAQKGKVVLLAHDFMFRDAGSTAKLRRFIHLMRDRGWKFRKIEHYSMKKPEPLYVARYYRAGKLAVKQSSKAISSTLPTANKNREIPTKVHRKRSEQISGEKHSLQARLNDAVRRYKAEDVERILKIGARINGKDEYGRTAINTAIKANSIFLVKRLLAHGADIHQKDGRGYTALQTARAYQRYEIENYLVRTALQRNTTKVQETKVIAVAAESARRNPLKALALQ